MTYSGSGASTSPSPSVEQLIHQAHRLDTSDRAKLVNSLLGVRTASVIGAQPAYLNERLQELTPIELSNLLRAVAQQLKTG